MHSSYLHTQRRFVHEGGVSLRDQSTLQATADTFRTHNMRIRRMQENCVAHGRYYASFMNKSLVSKRYRNEDFKNI
jgi:hypothetical protein